MTLAETMAMIEQDEFAAQMNLAAGTTAFRRAIREHELFHRLSECAKENPSALTERIEMISHIEIDERYENHFDTALSAYLLALSDVDDPEVASEASQSVLRTPKIWWASGIARDLLLQTVAVGANGNAAVAQVEVRAMPVKNKIHLVQNSDFMGLPNGNENDPTRAEWGMGPVSGNGMPPSAQFRTAKAS